MRKPNVSIACFGPGAIVTLSFILSQIASKRCDYAATGFAGVTDQQLQEKEPQTSEMSGYDWGNDFPAAIGLRCWQSVDGSNYYYPDGVGDFFNSSHNAAKAFGIITTIFGAIAIVYFFMAICVDMLNSATGYALIGSLLLLTCFFECMTFLLFQSSICIFGCSLDTASRCGVAACVFWFVSSVMTCAAASQLKNKDNVVPGEEDVKAAEPAQPKDKDRDQAQPERHSSGEDTEPHDHADDVEKQTPQETETPVTSS